MTSGDKATVAVLLVVGTILSGWALLELLTGFPDLVEWIKLGCGLLCYSGGCLMILWPTLKEKRETEPAPEPEPEPCRSARAAEPATVVQSVEVEGYKVQYRILRRSYATLAAAILATGTAMLLIAFYTVNFAAIGSPYRDPSSANVFESIGNSLVNAVAGGFQISAVFMGLAAASFWAGYAAPVKGLVLAGAICTTVATLAMLLWGILTIPVAILGYVGYARTGKPLAKYIEYQAEKK